MNGGLRPHPICIAQRKDIIFTPNVSCQVILSAAKNLLADGFLRKGILRLFADANFAPQTAQDDKEGRFPPSNTTRSEATHNFTLHSSLFTLKKSSSLLKKRSREMRKRFIRHEGCPFSIQSCHARRRRATRFRCCRGLCTQKRRVPACTPPPFPCP